MSDTTIRIETLAGSTLIAFESIEYNTTADMLLDVQDFLATRAAQRAMGRQTGIVIEAEGDTYVATEQVFGAEGVQRALDAIRDAIAAEGTDLDAETI